MENLFIVIVIMNCLSCYYHLRNEQLSEFFAFSHLEIKQKTSKFSTNSKKQIFIDDSTRY